MNNAASSPSVQVTHDRLVRAVERALRAPSVHNTQPWRWKIGHDAVELYADRMRKLPSTDPDGRDLVMSCGAALHHLRVALAELGFTNVTELLPDPENNTLMAVVRVGAGPADERDVALAPAIEKRRTERRALVASPSPVQLRLLAEHAARLGTTLHPVLGNAAQARLVAILDDAGDRQRRVPGYAAEMATWTHRYPGGHDGIPRAQRTAQATAYTLRDFPAGDIAGAPLPRTAFEGGSTVVVLTTDHDDVRDWLHAGEAASAVLLAATQLGLATTPLSQATEVENTRRRLASATLGISGYPQFLIRIGHLPIDAVELPQTPRRPLKSVLHRD